MREYERTGVLSLDDLQLPSEDQLRKGVAITECVQEIPCNPCVTSCPVQAITMEDINAPPVVDYDRCVACGRCVGVCPGLAIFVVKLRGNRAEVTLPYEFLPVPKAGDSVEALDREGNVVDTGVIKKVKKQGKTWVITVEVDKTFVMDVRNIKV